MSEDKRQDDELELAPDAGDEDLMSDFKDLFPEDEAEEGAAEGEGRDASEALDELDAFLDDFEQGFDPDGDAAGKSSSDTEEDSRQLELEDDDLDLAVSEAADEVAFGDDWAPEGGQEELDEPEEQEPELVLESEPPAQQELNISAEEVAAVAAGASASSAASQTVTPSVGAVAQGGGPGKGAMLAVAGTLLLVLVLSAAALWIGLGTTGRLDAMEQKLSHLPQASGRAPSLGTNAQIQAELRNLTARVNELAVIIEGPISHLRQSSEESLAAIEQRLSKLEQGAVAPAVATPPAPIRKLVEKSGTAPHERAPVAEASTRNSDSAWVINLISLRSEKDAQEEMLRLRKAGVRVEMQRALSDGQTWYRLRVPGFTSYEGAKAYINTVEKQAGVKNAWVAKQ